MAINVPYSKMNGLGNKIIVADMRGRADEITADAAIALAGREEMAFDQIMQIYDPSSEGVDADIRILNCDGSTAGACGNGMRCVVSLMHRENLQNQNPEEQFTFKTPGGIALAQVVSDQMISVDMGTPKFDWRDIPLAEEFADTTRIELQIGPIDAPILHSPSVASMGNPHCIFWVDEDIWAYELERFGPMLENHPIFPNRANITLARVLSDDQVKIRTWERGTGLTQACGSAACATLVSAVRKGYTHRKANINVPGGDLIIEWRGDDHVIMTGPTELEFSGKLDPATGAFRVDNESVAI